MKEQLKQAEAKEQVSRFMQDLLILLGRNGLKSITRCKKKYDQWEYEDELSLAMF